MQRVTLGRSQLSAALQTLGAQCISTCILVYYSIANRESRPLLGILAETHI